MFTCSYVCEYGYIFQPIIPRHSLFSQQSGRGTDFEQRLIQILAQQLPKPVQQTNQTVKASHCFVFAEVV